MPSPKGSPQGSPTGSPAGSPSRKGDKSAVKVMVRIRPFNSRELRGLDANDFPTSILQFQDNQVHLLDKECAQNLDTFTFHETFWSIPESQKQYGCLKPFAGQAEVFNYVGLPAVETAMSGRHCCIFAYGQTGTGKSYTMLGSVLDPGIAPRVVDKLYESLEEQKGQTGAWECSVEISFMEIYNERVKDLLIEEAQSLRGGSLSPAHAARRGSSPAGSPVSPRRQSTQHDDSPTGSPMSARRKSRRPSVLPADAEEYQDLRVRQSQEIGVFVEGLTRLGKADGLDSAASVKRIMRRGMEHRATAETKMNSTSSRSHAIFQICLRMNNPLSGKKRYSHINLVDLAGSERVNMSGATGQTLVEATRINLSLSTLRRVIDILVENVDRKKGQKSKPPYRESMLTWVLSESLGGNSETIMLATTSPAESNREDTLNTLRYAMKAKKIENVVRVNEQQGNVAMGAMQAEMQRMRAQLTAGETEGDGGAQALRDQQEEAARNAEQTLADMQREKEELAKRQEEIARAEEERARLEQEAADMKAEGVDVKHEEERVRQAEAEEELRRQEQERERREAEAREKEAQAERERKARDELEKQREATEQRQRESSQAAHLLRKQQFALAFSKAFAKSEATTGLTEERSKLAEVRDAITQAEQDLRETTGRVVELRTAKAALAVRQEKLSDSERHLHRMREEDTTSRTRDLAVLRADHDVAHDRLREIKDRHEAATDRHATLKSRFEAVSAARDAELKEKGARMDARRAALAELRAKVFKRKEELEALESGIRRQQQQVTELRRDTEAARAGARQMDDDFVRLEQTNADLRRNAAEAEGQLPGADAQCAAVRRRADEVRSILEEMTRNHESLKSVVVGRYFAPGEVRQEDVKNMAAPVSPRRDHTHSIGHEGGAQRVWLAGGYATVPDRSHSPRPRPRVASPARGPSPRPVRLTPARTRASGRTPPPTARRAVR